MDKNSLHAYLAAKYRAAKGGAVPSEDEEEDVEQEASEPEVTEAEPTEQAPTNGEPAEESDSDEASDEEPEQAQTSVSAVPDRAALVAALQAKYDRAGDNSNVEKAQAEANASNRFLNTAEPLEGFFRANGVAHGGPGTDHQSYQNARDQNALEVKQAEQARDKSIQGFLQKQAVDQQVTKQMIEQGSIAQKQQAMDYVKAAHTPGSQPSLKAVQQFNKIHPEMALDPKTTSLADVESMAKQVIAKDTNDTKKLAIQTKADIAKANAATAAGARADKADAAGEKAAAKADEKEKTAYTEYRGKMDGGGKGVPINVKNALVAQTNVKNAQEIIAQAGGDPNKLNEQQVQMLTGEIAKIATGGVPSEATQSHLNPNTFQQRWNKFLGQVGNKPQPAELGAFIQSNMDYLKGLGEVANGVVDKYQQGVHKAYRDRLSPDHIAEAETDYPNVVPKKASASATAAAPAPQAQTSTVAMTDPNGKTWNVPAGKVEAAKAKGWH